MRKNLILFLGVLLVASGCSYDEPISFLYLREVKVNGVEDGDLLISAKAVFKNPNNVKGRLKKVEILVIHQGDTLASVHEVNKMKVPANDEFSVPLSMKISIDKLQKGLLNNLVSLISKRTVDLTFQGNIKVASWGISQKVPVDYSETIKF